jgi:hypothetical protein
VRPKGDRRRELSLSTGRERSAASAPSPIPVENGSSPSPIPVEPAPAGAVFLHTARWFTRADAVALAHEILRLTEEPAM